MSPRSELLFSVRHGNLATIKWQLAKHGDCIDWYDFLVEALIWKRHDVAKLFLSSGARVNDNTSTSSTQSAVGCTPLHLAVRNGDKEIIEILLEKGAAVNVNGGRMKCTPLCEAVLYEKIEIAELLLKFGALVDIRNDENKTPLAIAVERGHINAARLLIQNGASVNAVMYKYERFIPIHLAAMKGHKDVLELLLDNGALVDAKTVNMSTPLHVAVDYQMKDVAQVLLNSHVDVNARTTDNETPLHMAVRKCRKDIVESLIQAGACVGARTTGSKTPLHLAVSRGSTDIVEVLLKSGADVNAKDDNFDTPLLLAVKLKRDEDLVECFFRYGADINIASADSRTPLHIAVKYRSIDIVESLLRNGANANAQLQDFRTPLHVAVSKLSRSACSKAKDIVELLLNNGANVNAKLTDLDTPLHLAIRNSGLDLIPLLLQRGADVDAEGRDCNTPLYLALDNNKLPPSIIMEILEYRPEVNNKSNQYAVSIATRRRRDLYEGNKEKIIKALLEYGFPIKYEDVRDADILSCIIRNGFVNIAHEMFQHCPNATFRSCSSESRLTPLHLASFHKQLEIAEMLLKCGADVNAQTSGRKTPLCYATANADIDMFGLFLRHQASVEGAHELLHLAAKSGSLDIVKLLLDRGLGVDVRYDNGFTALHCTNFSLDPEYNEHLFSLHCLTYGERSSANLETHKRIAEYLLLKGADVNARDDYRNTPLHIAVRQGSGGVAEVFLKHGADGNARNKYGDTALHISVRNKNSNFTRLLLKAGVEADAGTKVGSRTPLHLAVEDGDVNFIKLLLDSGANVHATYASRFFKDGTAFHMAIYNESFELVELLLDYGADVNAKCDGGTALHRAAERGVTDMVEILLKNGADINIKNKYNETPLDCVRSTCYDTSTPIIIHLMKMNLANLYLCERNLLFLRTDSLVKYCRYNAKFLQKLTEISSECEKEIAIMKCTRIGHLSVTYWDILRKSIQQLVWSLKNEMVVETLNREKYLIELTFPMYGSMIWNRFKYAKRRKELEEESERVFFDDYANGLPYICLDQILSYLTGDDLRALILAFR